LISDFDIESNFYRALFDGKSFKKIREKEGEYTFLLDPVQSYRANSYGYRSNEFSPETSLLSAGCSFTFGVGVPEDAIWANVLAKKLGLPVANVSRPGASIPWIVETIFTYFEKFGHPKYLLCLFPDESRTLAVVDGKIVAGSKDHGGDVNGNYGTKSLSGEQYIYDIRVKSFEESLATPSYIKKPYESTAVYTHEYSVYHAIRSIRRLEQYCNLAGITFAWSTWASSFNEKLVEINKEKDLKFNNFFELGISFYKKKEGGAFKDAIFYNEQDLTECSREHDHGVSCSCYLDCHSELIDTYGESNFYTGTDVWNGEIFSHPGVHLQTHFADRFIEQLMLECPHEFK